MLEGMAKIVEKKFNLKGKLYLNDGGVKKNTHKYRFFSKEICEYLISLGVPAGSKTIQKFLIPSWILRNKNFSKEFVKFAYYCEGSMKDGKRKTPRITFNVNKSEKLIKNGIEFCNGIREILSKNKIASTPVGIVTQKIRANGTAVMLRFRIITEDNHNFINKIGWLK